MSDLNDVIRMLEGFERRTSQKVYAGSGLHLYSWGMWSSCGPDTVIGAYVDGTPLTDWLGFSAQKFDRVFTKILTHYAPEGREAGSPTSAVLADSCADPHGVEWGKCEICQKKGLLARCGTEIASLDVDYGYCEEQPTYRVDGTRIENDQEWQTAMAAQVLRADFELLLIEGNAAVTNEFDGVERLVKAVYTDVHTGVSCPNIGSTVVDWAGDTLLGAVNTHGPFYRKVRDIIARFKQRAKGHGIINVARDVVIMCTSQARDAITEHAAFGQGFLVTGQVQIDVSVAMGRWEKYMTGGLFGDGWIPVDGVPVSFLVNDFIEMTASGAVYLTDVYILTRAVGNQVVLSGVYQDLRTAAAHVSRKFPGKAVATDEGRFLVYHKLTNNLCYNVCVVTRPGLQIRAPWLQARIYDVGISTQFQPISKRADSPYFSYGPYAQAYVANLPCY